MSHSCTRELDRLNLERKSSSFTRLFSKRHIVPTKNRMTCSKIYSISIPVVVVERWVSKFKLSRLFVITLTFRAMECLRLRFHLELVAVLRRTLNRTVLEQVLQRFTLTCIFTFQGTRAVVTTNICSKT